MEQAEEFLDNNKNRTKFLDIHLYMTSFSPNKDINAMALKLALDLIHLKVSLPTTKIFNAALRLWAAV